MKQELLHDCDTLFEKGADFFVTLFVGIITALTSVISIVIKCIEAVLSLVKLVSTALVLVLAWCEFKLNWIKNEAETNSQWVIPGQLSDSKLHGMGE